MTAQTKTVIKTYFETGDRPTQAQFINLIDSYQNISESLTAIQSAAATGSGLLRITNASAATLQASGTTGLTLLADTTQASARTNIGIGTSSFMVSMSTTTIGVKATPEFDFNFQINQVTMVADQNGSVVLDIWKAPFSSVSTTVPSSANSICASNKPTISNAIKVQTNTSAWTTTIVSAGDCLRFNIDSVTSCQSVDATFRVTRV